MRKSLNILLVEDDMIEIMKFNRTISKLACPHNIVEAKNGEEALDILYKNESLPDIILLDLNMPKINGLEFLGIIKKNNDLKYIPTIILTTSNNHKDVSDCHQLGIAGYLVKPLKFDDYTESIKRVLDYWCFNEFVKA
ncbi:MAG: response regulator [Lutibacter sp.]|nr:response regulator [Lutibacter sp.]